MKVKDIMSKNLIICSSDINVINISNIMKKYNIGFIPIEKKKKIIGVITDRDIVINIISNKVNNNSSIESYVNSNIIHIEENSVRFRINGVLEKHLESNPTKILELIERIKTLCGMNICKK